MRDQETVIITFPSTCTQIGTGETTVFIGNVEWTRDEDGVEGMKWMLKQRRFSEEQSHLI